ncbi:MAG: hypothetical protein HC812_04990 [Leptolyngbya sp. RL_3_1]|nr:hypothetical protein [Leptolyngbya sp. RL_3_1]
MLGHRKTGGQWLTYGGTPGFFVKREFSVYSFDVYDTCWVRTVARPTDLFLQLAQATLSSQQRPVSPEASFDLYHCRIQAEQQARAMAPEREDITLEAIYQALAPLTADGLDLSLMRSLELQLEAAAIRPITRIKAWIQQLRSQQAQIIFISDMYLPTAFIQQNLVRHGLAAPTDPVYVSGILG